MDGTWGKVAGEVGWGVLKGEGSRGDGARSGGDYGRSWMVDAGRRYSKT